MGFIHAVIFALVLLVVQAEIYLPCEEGQFVQQEGCECVNPQAPIISCNSIGLTSIPNITKAHTLNLDNNSISHLPVGAFMNISGLKRIRISRNKISALNSDVFKGVENMLEMLDLSGNEFSEVPEIFGLDNGRGLNNLTVLSLSKNYLSNLEAGDFQGVGKLQILDLEGNPINVISPDAWQGLDVLWDLQLSPGGMDVVRIPTKNLNQLVSLGLYDGRPQKLTYFKTWLENFPHLQHLKLVRMGLRDEHLMRGSFPESWKLHFKSLSLSDNELETIPWHSLQFPRLEELDLSSNMLSKAENPRNVVIPELIKKVNISNNLMSTVDLHLLLRWPFATSIDFSNNQVELTNYWSTSRIDTYMSPDLVFHLGGNPFYCGCGYTWMKDLVHRQLSNGNGHLTLYEINNTFRCGPRGKHDGELIKDIPRNEFC